MGNNVEAVTVLAAAMAGVIQSVQGLLHSGEALFDNGELPRGDRVHKTC